MSRLFVLVSRVSLLSLGLVLATGCASESHRKLEVEQTESSKLPPYSGPKRPLMVGKFANKSGYMQGAFTEGPDRLSGQAKTVLIGHLQRTRRFSVLDRDNMEETANEAKISGKAQKLKGASYTVTGDIVEFGRKETGDKQLYGIVGSGKQQIAYSKVTLNVVDVSTSEVVFSVSGAGEYALSEREVLGFGGRAGYDSTLNGKVLDLAMREAVDRLVEGLHSGEWGKE